MSALPHFAISPAEYLVQERAAEYKSEYYNGHPYVLAGASERHNTISGNVFVELHTALKQRPCKVYTNDLKVATPGLYKFFYPDVVVVCGTPQFHDSEKDVVLNPLLIIEVLSESTERYDRGQKFQTYQQIESLREYVLVAQNDFVVETFSLQDNGDWLYHKASGLNNIITLTALGCQLALADIYAKVE